ncbi:TPA: hypothetical protein ACH3X2_009609 [Trebouxia sp. C0005]
MACIALLAAETSLETSWDRFLVAWNSNPRYLYDWTRSTSLPLNVKAGTSLATPAVTLLLSPQLKVLSRAGIEIPGAVVSLYKEAFSQALYFEEQLLQRHPAEGDKKLRDRLSQENADLLHILDSLVAKGLQFTFKGYGTKSVWEQQNLAKFTCTRRSKFAKSLDMLKDTFGVLYAWDHGKDGILVQVQKLHIEQTFEKGKNASSPLTGLPNGAGGRAASPEVTSSNMSDPASTLSQGSLGVADFMDPGCAQESQEVAL